MAPEAHPPEYDALKRAVRVAEEKLIFFVEIQAVGDEAKAIYQHRGFSPMEDESMKLYMNLKEIRRILSDS